MRSPYRKNPKLYPHNKRPIIWQAIRELREFTTRDMINLTSMHKDTLRSYFKALMVGGYLQRDEGNKFITWRLIKDVGIEAPRIDNKGNPLPETSNSRMWAAMKTLGTFTYMDVAFAADVEKAAAKDYIKHLKLAGYLHVLMEANNGPDKAKTVFRLLASKNTGPQSPRILKIKAVYDPNLRKIMTPNSVYEVVA